MKILSTRRLAFLLTVLTVAFSIPARAVDIYATLGGGRGDFNWVSGSIIRPTPDGKYTEVVTYDACDALEAAKANWVGHIPFTASYPRTESNFNSQTFLPEGVLARAGINNLIACIVNALSGGRPGDRVRTTPEYYSAVENSCIARARYSNVEGHQFEIFSNVKQYVSGFIAGEGRDPLKLAYSVRLVKVCNEKSAIGGESLRTLIRFDRLAAIRPPIFKPTPNSQYGVARSLTWRDLIHSFLDQHGL